MHFTSEQRLDDGVREREFALGEIPGTLWTPGSVPAPLVLMAHNNGLPKADPRLVARARYTAARGYAVATIDAAGCGDRPRSAADEQARADLRRAMQAGEPVDEIFESLVGPLVDNAVPEWRTTLDALLELPGVRGPVGYSGGWTALGIRLAVAEPRIAAAGFFAGGPCPGPVLAATWYRPGTVPQPPRGRLFRRDRPAHQTHLSNETTPRLQSRQRGAGPPVARVLHVCSVSAMEDWVPKTGRPSRRRGGRLSSTL
ncbi:hypothetical protein ACFYOA_31655 [Streptomyces iakyrus]|uniref:hypothetical protein n=1 Tax=Streptomyces iakyrus TaxID=68219 RepID=UPI0036B275CD